MSSANDFKDDGPDRIAPTSADRKVTLKLKGQRFVKAFTTKDGLIGKYDYGFLFKPNLPFLKKEKVCICRWIAAEVHSRLTIEQRAAPFFGLNDKMPVFLALLLGFQHALSMLAGVITPPIILAGAANLSGDINSYLVSTSLIVCGILSAVQITRFHVYGTPYYIGTGLISVVGTSFAVSTFGLVRLPIHDYGIG
jgi:hypothetical protein